MENSDLFNYLVAGLLIIGGFFVFVGSLGLAKLPDFFTRLHAPTKATTLGIGSVLIASMLVTSVREGGFSVYELVISLFLFITAPVSAHMMAKAALHKKISMLDRTKNHDMTARIAAQKTPQEEQQPEDSPA
ncbi:MAG: Na+/H+ antiporter subunit G [Saccharospirillaceae bacterium]|nr:Na+/H+ antiporter subunit G [Thalassolituus sp. HI0120]MCH2042346.1 Na+/H+ antiporter subunit G [Saccharospirillaceae bacterium]